MSDSMRRLIQHRIRGYMIEQMNTAPVDETPAMRSSSACILSTLSLSAVSDDEDTLLLDEDEDEDGVEATGVVAAAGAAAAGADQDRRKKQQKITFRESLKPVIASQQVQKVRERQTCRGSEGGSHGRVGGEGGSGGRVAGQHRHQHGVHAAHTTHTTHLRAQGRRHEGVRVYGGRSSRGSRGSSGSSGGRGSNRSGLWLLLLWCWRRLRLGSRGGGSSWSSLVGR